MPTKRARRFFVPDGSIVAGEVRIVGPDVRHIGRVLRLAPGDRVEVVDEAGGAYSVELVSVESSEVAGRIVQALGRIDEGARLVLFQGLPKGSKMDGIIRGAVEAGADEIVPVISERSVPELDSAKVRKRVERWRRIAAEASKQAKRSLTVGVRAPLDFSEMLEILDEFELVLVFWEEEEEILVGDAISGTVSPIAAIIGPEGGLSVREVEAARTRGGRTVTFGKSILRTETAGVVAVALVRYELMRLSGKREG